MAGNSMYEHIIEICGVNQSAGSVYIFQEDMHVKLV
jgi:hypothetical protein